MNVKHDRVSYAEFRLETWRIGNETYVVRSGSQFVLAGVYGVCAIALAVCALLAIGLFTDTTVENRMGTRSVAIVLMVVTVLVCMAPS